MSEFASHVGCLLSILKKRIFVFLSYWILQPSVRLCISVIFVFSVTQLLSYDSNLIAFAASNNSSSWTGALESHSTSSSVSLETFRTVIAADNEAEIYRRIHHLENCYYYNLPPQNNPGDYERLVREHFDQALSVSHYREILDREYFELQVLERKGLLQWWAL